MRKPIDFANSLEKITKELEKLLTDYNITKGFKIYYEDGKICTFTDLSEVEKGCLNSH